MEGQERQPTRDELLAAIRQHMNETGDDRCHADDGRLYSVLPEGDTRPERMTLVTIENCLKHIQCRQSGRAKCDEFPRRVIRRQVERANEASNPKNPTSPPPFYPPPERGPKDNPKTE